MAIIAFRVAIATNVKASVARLLASRIAIATKLVCFALRTREFLTDIAKFQIVRTENAKALASSTLLAFFRDDVETTRFAKRTAVITSLYSLGKTLPTNKLATLSIGTRLIVVEIHDFTASAKALLLRPVVVVLLYRFGRLRDLLYAAFLIWCCLPASFKSEKKEKKEKNKKYHFSRKKEYRREQKNNVFLILRCSRHSARSTRSSASFT
jgi:hypothetical protein